MAVAVKVDIIENARVVERGGLVEEVVRIARVTGLEGTASDRLLDALAAADLPEAGDQHPHEDYDTLYLDERAISTHGSASSCDVDLIYRRLDAGLESNPDATTIYTGGTSLVQIETEKDRDGAQITVTHPVPTATSPGVIQGGTVKVLSPQTTLTAVVIESTNVPGSISQAWAGYVNASSWQGGEPGTWLCTSANFEPVSNNTSPRKWRFVYEFQYEPTGHNPTVFYIDPTTGRPPDGLVEDFGFKKITWYREKNFGSKFS